MKFIILTKTNKIPSGSSCILEVFFQKKMKNIQKIYLNTIEKVIFPVAGLKLPDFPSDFETIAFLSSA